MKRISFILPLFCLLVLLTACVNDEKSNSLKEPIDTTSQGLENFVDYYPNGIIKIKGEKWNGKRNGKWLYYYEDGILWSEGEYRHGKREGFSIVYYENGKKKIEGQYKDDLRVGKWKVWEDDGTLIKIVDMDSMLSPKDSLNLGIQ